MFVRYARERVELRAAGVGQDSARERVELRAAGGPPDSSLACLTSDTREPSTPDLDTSIIRETKNLLDLCFLCAEGLNHLPHRLSISVSMAVIKDFSTNYMKAQVLKQAYMLLKLRKKYYIVLISFFISSLPSY